MPVSITPSQDSPRAGPGLLRELAATLRLVPARKLAFLLGLMGLVALTDGVGVAMLVPLLQLASSAAPDPKLVDLFGWLGVSPGIGILLIGFVALVAIRAALVYALAGLRARMHHGVSDGLRRRCYAALVRAEWRWLSAQRSADHNAVLVTNCNQVGTGLDQALGLTFNALTTAAMLAIALILAWQVALFALVAGVLLLLMLRGLRQRSEGLGLDTGTGHRDLHRHVETGIRQFRETKILGNEAVEIERLDSVVDKLRVTKQRYRDDNALSTAAIQLGTAILLAATVHIGLGWAAVPWTRLLPLLLIFMRLAPIVQGLQLSWSFWLYSLAAQREVIGLIASAEAHAEPMQTDRKSFTLGRTIALDDVIVRHAERSGAALADVSLTIPVRTTLAIVGRSGAGKSTLADVLAGLISPDSGQLLIDGQPLMPGQRQQWRNSVAYVQQDPFLDHASIRSNLLWARPDAPDEALAKALRAARAEFVFDLPAGLDTVVGDSGLRLSGGERQRVALARTLLREPQLLILDEATSALDPECEAAILEALAAMHGALTIVIVGHRPAMLKHADAVVELRDGKLVEPQAKAEAVRAGVRP